MKRNYLLSITLLCFTTTIFGQSNFDCSALDPIVAATEINMCEPGGKVVLEAQLNTGNRIFWYDAVNSDSPVSTEETIDLGNVSSDVSYWVTEGYAEKGPKITGQALQLKDEAYAGGPANSGWGVLFEANQSFIINSVDVYSSDNGGDIIIQLKDEQGNLLEEKKELVPRGSKDNLVRHIVNLDFEIPQKGIYSLSLKDGGIGLTISLTNSPDKFPYPLEKVGDVIDGFMGVPSKGKFYAYFYNWTVQAVDLVCESDRKEISISINDDYPDDLDLNSPITLCGSGSFTLEDVDIDANDLQWFNEFGSELSSTTMIEEGVVYNVAAVSPGGCRSATESVSFVMQDLSDQPLAEVEQSFEEGSGDTLASLEVEGENLQWYADADKEEGLSEETELEDATTYYVTQTIENHCESEPLGITVSEILGMKEVAFESLQYNNPVTGVLYLSNNEDFEDIKLYDIKGKQLSVNIVESNFSNINIDLSDFSPGTYLVSFKVKGFRKTVQIIKN